jgi:alpha-glucosidase
MPPLRETLPFAWPVLRSLVEPKNLAARASTVYRRVRRLRARPEAPAHLGDLQTIQSIPAGLDLRCEGGVMRVQFVSNGVARVRTSRDGTFPSLHSYAVIDPARQTQPTVNLDGPIQVASPLIRVSVSPTPCRLSFGDASGNVFCAEAEGAGWQGEAVSCSHLLPADLAVYGLGEKAFGLNHRGRRLALWNTDPISTYRTGTDPLYGNIPWMLGQREGRAYGVLFDNTHRAHFDIGGTDPRLFRYRADGGELCYYVVTGPSPADVLARYADLTGHMPLPPRWGLGYHQSRWSYMTEGDVRQVVSELRARSIPCDAIYLDIDYMDGYRLFTWNASRYPDPRKLIAGLAEEGVRTVVIVDPGVKVDPSYPVCADGVADDVFCRLPDGRLYTGPVWPGDCYFPDFSNEAVREWWGSLLQPLVNAGVAGFWNDMNEPAVFPGTTLPGEVQHRTDSGIADHREIHNVYGQLMARATAEGSGRSRPGERTFTISRAGYAGIQRHALNWTGDNESSWEHLRLSIPMVLNLGLSGQPFSGPDIGGFSGHCNGELLARWTQVGAFLPFFRNHSAISSHRQEPYAFGDPWESICRRYIELRYRLLPYTYTGFWQAAERGLPVARPLALAFPADRRVASLDDEYLFGDALLVAPILSPGGVGRGVYLPRAGWYDFWTGESHLGPDDVPAHAPLEVLPLYARAGSVVPMSPVMQYSDQFVPAKLDLHLFPGSGTSWLYEDDGHSTAHLDGIKRVTSFEVQMSGHTILLLRTTQGDFDPGYEGYDILLRADPAWSSEAAPEDRTRGGWTAGGGVPVQALTVTVDGVRQVSATVDAEWNALRLSVGRFDRVEVSW